MDYAKDTHSGRIVAAEDASRWHSYVCPRPGCGGSVFPRDGGNRRPHFAHRAGQGTPACDEYHPGSGWPSEAPSHPIVEVESEPAELGLVLVDSDNTWTLNLRVPEIPATVLGSASLLTLQTALVEVFAGPLRSRLSALDLRPGVGTARVAVLPTLQAYRTEPSGTWPTAIDERRWILRSRGLNAMGTLFRLRQGEWTRLLAHSAVHRGETLMLLADRRSPPPPEVPSRMHFTMLAAGLEWAGWEIQIPDEVDAAGSWASRLGHALVPRPWQLTLVTPPRGFTDARVPIFWLGTSVVVRLDAPHREADTTSVDQLFDSNTWRKPITTGDDGTSYLKIMGSRPGPVRVSAGGVARSAIDLQFVPPPTGLPDLLARTPRLRLRIGDQALTAWDRSDYAVTVQRSAPTDVEVDLGFETARAQFVVLRKGMRRTSGPFGAKELASALGTALRDDDVTSVAIDAEGLGTIRLIPSAAARSRHDETLRPDRLAWRAELLAQLSFHSDQQVTTLARHPKDALRLRVQPGGISALLRSRLFVRGKSRRDSERR